MFNWNDQDQVGGTVWGECNKSEDHIVPHPNETEEDSLFSFGDYRKKQINEGVSTNAGSTEETSQAENDFLSCKLENSSCFHTNEELSASRIEMDTWSDFSNLTASLGGTMQLDGDADLFGHENNESDHFLDCDWANVGDLDDLDKIFRNSDVIFGHEMIDDADGFLSPSTDVISRTAQSIPMPDIPLCKDQTSDKDCSTFQLDERSDGKRNTLQKEKSTDSTLKAEGQTLCQTYLAGEYCGTHSQFSRKVDEQKRIVKSQKKAEEKSKNKPLRNINDAWSNNVSRSQHVPRVKLHSSGTTPPQTFHSKSISQKMQVGDAKPVEHLGSSNQVTFTEHGFPTYAFPGFPLPSHVHVDRNQKRPIPVCLPEYHPNISNKLPDAKSVTMTPQEKIEELRRRQQMHAMLAIQQQQKQYSHQTIGNYDTVSQTCSQKNQSQDAVLSTIVIEECSHKLPSSELNMLAEQDESQRSSSLIDGPSIEETIYYQLQDAMGKLDTKVRLCIRDSLFRLARSVMERQSASDRSSTNKSNKDEDEFSADEESNNHDRSWRLTDSERDTNPIDRIVTQLLFQSPTASCPRPATDELL